MAAHKGKDLPIAPAFTRPAAPSSSTAGFFQRPPKVSNQFYEDTAFRRAFECKLFDYGLAEGEPLTLS